jgi:hypothetical protein
MTEKINPLESSGELKKLKDFATENYRRNY